MDLKNSLDSVRLGRTSSGMRGEVLARGGSAGARSDDNIKAVAQRFDLEIVFKLSLQSKGIQVIAGLDKCINLTDLNLSDNAIERIQGLDALLQLRRLNLASNRITRLENIWHLKQLEALQLQDNQLASLDSLSLQQLGQLPALRILYLQNLDHSVRNPVCALPAYKEAVVGQLQQLTNLDGERSPDKSGYAEVVEEVLELTLHPPAPKEVELPEVAPWLQDVSLELPAAQQPAEVEGKARNLIKAVDECRMLQVVLTEEVGKFRKQLTGG